MQFLKQSLAIVVTSFIASGVQAAVLKNSSGPAEVPPASFSSTQYVDSKGCVYVRAGVGASVTWVPRVTRSRELVCGYAPSLGRSATSVQATQKPSAAARAPSTVTTSTVAQPQSTTVVRAAPSPAPAPTVVASSSVQQKAVYQQPKVQRTPRLPKGYKPVWDDGRLNPHRGVRTASGEASMRRIWTDTVPRRLVSETGQDGKLVQAHLRFESANGTTTSTKTAPTRKTAAQSGGRYVQIGAFSVSGGADATARKFNKMGYPVASRKISQGGRDLKVLYLGPFSSAADLNAGLNSARSAGFSNAVIK